MADGPNAPAGVDLTPEERADIDGMYLRMASGTLYEFLGVPLTADRKTLRDAYFAISQRFHPDAFFGRNLGPWKSRIEEIFREATRAYEVLSNRNKRAEYDRSLGGAPRATAPVAAPPASEPMAAAVPTPPAPPSAPAPDVLPPAPPPEPPPAAPVATVSPPSPVPSRASPAMPAISPEAAQRAAREALARKLGLRPGAAPPSVAGVGNAPRPADSAAALASPLASLDAMRVARTQAERDAKIAYLTRTADESLARNDLLGASNALAVAATLAPEDATLRARADDVARRLAMSFAVRNAEEARRAERSGDWAEAAACWQKVVNAHPQDAVALERAAHALLRLGRDLPRAAELARRATQQSPPRVEAYTTLAQIFIAGGLRASALGALETASKLDPASVVVKDLLAKVKA